MKKSFGEKLKSLFSRKAAIDDDFYDELIELLVEGDIGAKTAYTIVDELQKICSDNKIREEDKIILELKKLLLADVKAYTPEIQKDKVNVWMVLGVNGVPLFRKNMKNLL